VSSSRTLMVPDGLAGERLDAALSRLFGVSRTKAAEMIEAGLVQMDGSTALKSSRVSAGVMLDVELPPPPTEVTVVPETVDNLRIVHDEAETRS